MTYPKEFKEAISQLPSKEKDKLILRLLKKDLNLTNRLFFELIDDRSVEERREIIKNRIITQAQNSARTFYSVGYLNMDVRYLSGEISEHVYITKDKFGEVQLNLLMINEVLSANKENLNVVKDNKKARKFYTAVIARAFKILLLMKKLDEDYWIEFAEDLKRFGELIGSSEALMNTAIFNSFDVNWLLSCEIPDDIVAHHKDLRANGYLK